MPSRHRDGNAKQVNVRMPRDELKSLDVWIKTQPAPCPTRAEAIRRLVGQALVGGAQPSQKRRENQRPRRARWPDRRSIVFSATGDRSR